MDHATDPQRKPITVSIVVHRQWRMAMPLIEQLQRHCGSWIDRVVLTVNVPEAEDAERSWTLPVVVVRNEQPQGFGANHNAAFRHCRTPWFLVLNPDIRLDADAIAPLLRFARTDTGLLSPRIQEPDRSAPEPFRCVPTPLELLRRRLPGHRSPAAPEWLAGMFMLARSDAFASVGGFDERFHMYCEDVDLCLRLRLGGWNLQVVEDVTVQHEAQRASNTSLRPLLWHLESLGRLWASGSFWRYLMLRRRSLAPH